MNIEEETKAVQFLGEIIGYGNLMTIASKLWQELLLANNGSISGAFVPVLPCDVKPKEYEFIKSNKSSQEGWMLTNGKVGDVFYSDKSDRAITAFANYYKRSVTTERLIAVTSQSNNPVACKITKVTLGSFKESIHDTETYIENP